MLSDFQDSVMGLGVQHKWSTAWGQGRLCLWRAKLTGSVFLAWQNILFVTEIACSDINAEFNVHIMWFVKVDQSHIVPITLWVFLYVQLATV